MLVGDEVDVGEAGGVLVVARPGSVLMRIIAGIMGGGVVVVAVCVVVGGVEEDTIVGIAVIEFGDCCGVATGERELLVECASIEAWLRSVAAWNAGGGGDVRNTAFVGDNGGERVAGPTTSTLGVVGCGVLLRCVVDKANGCCCGGGKSTAITCDKASGFSGGGAAAAAAA